MTQVTLHLAESMHPMAWPALTAPGMPLPEPAVTREPFSLHSLPGALDFVTFETATRPGLSPEWQERLLAAMDPTPVPSPPDFRGITVDPRLVIYDECTATLGGHGIPQSAYAPTAREAPWS